MSGHGSTYAVANLADMTHWVLTIEQLGTAEPVTADLSDRSVTCPCIGYFAAVMSAQIQTIHHARFAVNPCRKRDGRPATGPYQLCAEHADELRSVLAA